MLKIGKIWKILLKFVHIFCSKVCEIPSLLVNYFTSPNEYIITLLVIILLHLCENLGNIWDATFM